MKAFVRAAADAGISYRQADHWRTKGYLTVTHRTRYTDEPVDTRGHRATGYVAYLEPSQVRKLTVMATLVKAGMRPDAASPLADQIVADGHADLGERLTITQERAS